jgi:PPOX class probable F420-dependent enzyme
MTTEIDAPVRRFIDAHRVARLATVDATGHPFVVPVCYALVGAEFFSAIDEKPKRAAPAHLQRVRNIEAHPQVALLIDDYSEDWSELAYVLVHGAAAVLHPPDAPHARAVAALRDRYPQYHAMRLETRPMIRIAVDRVRAWSARDGSELRSP